MSPRQPQVDAPAGEVLVVIHVDSGWNELERDIVLETRPDERLYLLVPAEEGNGAPSDGRELAGQASATVRLNSLLSDIQRDGRSAAGEVGEVFVLDSVADVLARRLITDIVVATPPLRLANALHLDLAHRVQRAFGLPTRHVTVEAAHWSGGLDLSIGAGYDAARERAPRRPSGAGQPLRSGRRTAVALGALAALLAAGLAVALPWGFHETSLANRRLLTRETAEPSTYTVLAGASSPAGDVDEFEAYYPATIEAHAGDAVTFHNPTADVPHTVTFGVAETRSDEPVFGLHGGGPILSIVAPCATNSPLTPAVLTCPGASPPQSSSGPPPTPVAFSGQTYYNSGVIAPGQQFTLRLAAVLKPGIYHYYCLIHGGQQGTIVVRPAGRATQLQSSVDAAAGRQLARDRRTVAALAAPGSVPALHIQAGVAAPDVSLNQFFPAKLHVRVGQAVTWDNSGTTPHVVIFGEDVDPAIAGFSPPTAPAGSDYGGGAFLTGPIGAAPSLTSSFTLRFIRPGDYPFICTLHLGMAGTITVDP
jgi:plastocyanin